MSKKTGREEEEEEERWDTGRGFDTWWVRYDCSGTSGVEPGRPSACYPPPPGPSACGGGWCRGEGWQMPSGLQGAGSEGGGEDRELLAGGLAGFQVTEWVEERRERDHTWGPFGGWVAAGLPSSTSQPPCPLGPEFQ